MDDTEIADLIQQCNDEKISLQELQQKLAGSGVKLHNKKTERNPKYPEGNNQSRNGFIYNPIFHPKGQFFQNIVKKAILKAIDFAHGSIVRDYDRDAYVYEDSRLQELNVYFRNSIDEGFRINTEYTTDFLNKIADIILFLMKEDIRYRRFFIVLFANMPRNELNEDEKKNRDAELEGTL